MIFQMMMKNSLKCLWLMTESQRSWKYKRIVANRNVLNKKKKKKEKNEAVVFRAPKMDMVTVNKCFAFMLFAKVLRSLKTVCAHSQNYVMEIICGRRKNYITGVNGNVLFYNTVLLQYFRITF